MNTLNDYLPDFIIEEIKRLTRTKEEVDDEIKKRILKHIDEHPEKPWSGLGLSKNPNLCSEHFPHMSRYNDNVSYRLSKNPNITLDYITTHPNINWNWCGISRNPNITLDYILAHSNKPWNWYGVSKNPSITLKDVVLHPCVTWNLRGLSRNPNMTMKYIEEHPKKTWDWFGISKHMFTKEKAMISDSLLS